MEVFLIGLIVALPALMWFFLWRVQDKEREPFHAMLWCFFLGVAASLPFFVLKQVGISVGNDSWQIFLFAFLEEIVKAIMVVIGIEISRHWFTQIVDGLIYGSAVALGFAFAENVFYLIDLVGSTSSLVTVYLVRSLDTMLGHTLFTALFGFFYASAYLRKEIFPKKKKEKPWYHFFFNLWEALPLHVTLFHLLPNRPSKHGHYPGSLILEGILVASGLHGLFNLLHHKTFLGTSLGFLTVPLVSLVVYGIWRMFLQGVYVRVVRRVKG
ncbi:MAG: PrsW family glutamic-type intramembrane protease [Candidatus Altimarinota bacterium]